MSENIRVVVYGLGPIGALIARNALNRKGIEVVGGVDIAPDKVGKDLGDVIGLGRHLGVDVVHDNDSLSLLLRSKPHVVLHSTSTYLDKIYPQIVKCIKAGADIISTSETLAYPWYRYPELAFLIDEVAKKQNVTVLGTGVNPGFVFDTLPAFLSSVCVDVGRIHVVRSIDASKRRYSFQKKYGLSMTPQEFRDKISRGEITAHVGYAESIMLISHMLGLKIDKIEEGQEPIIADKYMETQYFKIHPGQVCGIRGYGIGYIEGREFIKLELLAAVGRTDYDEVTIEGNPPLKWRNEYGTAGDTATAAMIINVIPRVLNASPGLLTMKDVAIPSIYLGTFRF
jgi:4-hydroxy-tetrahydrodipicolinate reductase